MAKILNTETETIVLHFILKARFNVNMGVQIKQTEGGCSRLKSPVCTAPWQGLKVDSSAAPQSSKKVPFVDCLIQRNETSDDKDWI